MDIGSALSIDSPNHLVTFLGPTLIDDFFVFGFIGGLVGYAYYSFATRGNHGTPKGLFTNLYGLFTSGALGGLLAIVFDRSLELAILVGLTNQVLYMTILKATKSGSFWDAVKDVIVKLLTAGAVPPKKE